MACLNRRWMYRVLLQFHPPSLRVPQPAAPPAGDGANVLVFRTIEPYKPRTAALFQGGCLAVALFYAGVSAMSHGGTLHRFLIGVHHAGPRLLPVATPSAADAELNTAVEFPAEPPDPLRPIAIAYFRMLRVLAVLDGDGDQILSPWEIITAPAALRRLDVNHDGKLTPEECGFRPGGLPPDVAARVSLAFMRDNPVLAALDANHDGEISEEEIALSTAALKTLDLNRDGSLTADELLPDRLSLRAGMILARFDSNQDGILTPAEWSVEDAGPLREFLQSADRNHDGRVTREELEHELRVREESSREVENARRATGKR